MRVTRSTGGETSCRDGETDEWKSEKSEKSEKNAMLKCRQRRDQNAFKKQQNMDVVKEATKTIYGERSRGSFCSSVKSGRRVYLDSAPGKKKVWANGVPEPPDRGSRARELRPQVGCSRPHFHGSLSHCLPVLPRVYSSS